MNDIVVGRRIDMATDDYRDVRVIQVVQTNLFTRGDGTKESPIRRVTQYWSLDGRLLAEHDPNDEPRIIHGDRDE